MKSRQLCKRLQDLGRKTLLWTVLEPFRFMQETRRTKTWMTNQAQTTQKWNMDFVCFEVQISWTYAKNVCFQNRFYLGGKQDHFEFWIRDARGLCDNTKTRNQTIKCSSNCKISGTVQIRNFLRGVLTSWPVSNWAWNRNTLQVAMLQLFWIWAERK